MQSVISDYVRRRDRDHFICSLFIAQPVRRYYLALYAFNIEINNIIYDCNEVMTALVRLEWWREKITMIYHNKIVNDNKILSELANVIYSAAIPKFLINEYLNGYERIIHQTSYKSTLDLEKIAVKTTVNLMKMLFITTTKDYSNDLLAYHCGVAWHLMNSIRNGTIENSNRDMVTSVVERAEYHINQVKILNKTAPKKIIKITLQARLAELYLKRFRSKKFSGRIGPVMQIRMLLHYFTLCVIFKLNLTDTN